MDSSSAFADLPAIAVLGAGPAGLSSAWELSRLGRRSVVFERDTTVGGLARTLCRDGYHFDIGGHRFFTKIPEVEALWREVLGSRLLRRPRLSRIFYRKKFFQYPLRALDTLTKIGPVEATAILGSYALSRLLPSPRQDTFEEWVSNQFGRRLFEVFFRTYTEKVWGIPCSEIEAEWAGQRIRGLSLGRAIVHSLGLGGQRTVKTLIDEFLYPETGPGLLYDEMTRRLEERGTAVMLGHEVVSVAHRDGRAVGLRLRLPDGRTSERAVSDVVSSIPLPLLVKWMSPAPPEEVRAAADALRFRSLVTVNLVVAKPHLFPDNWIYVHEPDVRVARIQNYKNWSPAMVPNGCTTSLGLEYFCSVGDDFWSLSEEEMVATAVRELEAIGLARAADVKSGFAVRVPRAYPVYHRGYREHLRRLREWLEPFENLHVVGRHGMFRYNNQDHATLTGFLAARNVVAGRAVHDLWSVNADDAYLETRTDSGAQTPPAAAAAG